MRGNSGKISLFEYLDYRQYLKDLYSTSKVTRQAFSFRTFSKRAGFTSSNFYKLVMDCDRNLTEESLVKFMKGLGLNKQEQDFFRNLVFFNQAKKHEEKDLYYQKLLQSRKFNQLKPIEKEQYEYYSSWYYAVVREMICAKGFDGSCEWLMSRIEPELSRSQVEKSIQVLEKLGFIKKVNDKWQQTSSLVTTGAESASLVLLNYHKSVLELTRDQLSRISPQDRDVSSLTLGISREKIPELKKYIQQFRQQVLKMVSTDVEPDEVLLLNIQMIPVTKTATGDRIVHENKS